jgi:MOSC domain-containing protein YiiM
MTALVATEYSAQIVWLGVITQRKSVELQTEARSFIKIDWNGVLGSAHSGRTRFSDVRVSQQHDKGTEISNVRQLSIVSQEDIEQISAGMCMGQFDPSWLGANLVVSGLPDFSHLPPSSRLQSANGTTLIVDMQNQPCHQIGKTIDLDFPGKGREFTHHAKGRRGITAWVERPGQLNLGDTLKLHCPEQRNWQPSG